MISGIVSTKLVPHRGLLEKAVLYVGIDVGRHVHPTHVAALVKDGVTRKFYQVASIWFDDEPYLKQVEQIMAYLKKVPHGKMVALYDNTRGEYGVLAEGGFLPRSRSESWQGIVLTRESKFRMASRLLVCLDRGELVLLPDRRQKESLLAVNNMMRAEETEAGHGESFTSLMLALEAASSGGVSFVDWVLSTQRR